MENITENKTFEKIGEAELEKVTGGGSGRTPAKDIRIEPYDRPRAVRYFLAKQPARKADGSFEANVVYVYEDAGGVYFFTYERLAATDKGWISSYDVQSGGWLNLTEFKEKFPFTLNVHP